MNGFTFFKDYYDLITLLPEKDQGELLLGIMKYMFDDEEPKLNKNQTKVYNNLKRPLLVSKHKSKNASKTNQTQIKSKSNENQNENGAASFDVAVDTSVDTMSMSMSINNKNINKNIYSRVVEYLNEKVGSSYKPTTKKTRDLITARMNEGFVYEDFKKVIDIKTEEWLNNKDMAKYLRPETLFSNHFEGYLNQRGALEEKPNSEDYKPDGIHRVGEMFIDSDGTQVYFNKNGEQFIAWKQINMN